MIRKGLMLTTAMLIGFAPVAVADDLGADGADQMQLMQRRLQALEDQLGAANDRIQQLEGRPVAEGEVPGFLQRLQFSGWVTGSYFYNFNDPDNNVLPGANSGVGCCIPFQPDANQFTFDQAWFELEHPIDPENRAGFRFEVAYGRVARLLPAGNVGGGGGIFGGNNLYIPAAYVQYLAPLGPLGDVALKFGKFGTLIGYEVAQSTGNWNITRSNVYNLLQPIDHVGILASGEIGETGISYAAGIVNNVFTTQPVTTDGKAYTAQLGYGTDMVSGSVSVIYGNDTGFGPGGDEEAKSGIVDLILEATPTDALTLALNADYRWTHQFRNLPRQRGWGVALYGNYAWTERLESTLRLDYVKDENGLFGFGGTNNDATLWSITGTIGYNLTENLKVRGEVRFDNADIDQAADNVFVSDGNAVVFGDDDQFLAGVDVTYSF